ncbi:MAG: hypothetical protein JWO47_451 [Candidatus Saccharibacteria bacterium]|nr:hypothetical protein [Candidatus Saccharibacteria bacterium]
MTKKEKKSGIIGVIVLVFIVFAVVSALTGGNKAVNDANKAVSNLGGNDAQAAPATTPVQTEPVATPAPATKVPAEYKSALSQAGSYSSTMHMSKQGVYDQLVSEYGGKFTAEAAQYAIDNVKADWNANALAKAKSYQDTMHQSPAAIHDQLTSEYGEKFTQVEADYAIQHLND